MAFTNNFTFKLTLLLCCSSSVNADYYAGLATRDQNPLLIPYWIPQTTKPNLGSDLTVSSSLFVTNTLHDESKLQETLIIDAEIYRLDLNVQKRINHWTYSAQIPFISTDNGFLDKTIVGWHDSLGLPQGKRLEHPNNQVNLQYQINGKTLISEQQPYNGWGDVSFTATRPIKRINSGIFNLSLGLNIPSNSHDLISNGAIDRAFWLSYLGEKKQGSPVFITLGYIKLGDGGVFKETLKPNVFFAQTGFDLDVTDHTSIQLQLDYHSSIVKSKTVALGDSFQIQLGLKLTKIWSSDIHLFFSEDIYVGSAPDISFGLKINWGVND